jgi:hypothetical protein
MTEIQDPAEITGVQDGFALDPITGELWDFRQLEMGDLAGAIGKLAEWDRKLGDFRQRIVDEMARRLDVENARKTVFDDLEVETNAPTAEEYLMDRLRDELQLLVDDGVLSEGVLARVFVKPPPKPQPERIDKRELNKLKKHDDRRVTAALGVSRNVVSTKRTIKITPVKAR